MRAVIYNSAALLIALASLAGYRAPLKACPQCQAMQPNGCVQAMTIVGHCVRRVTPGASTSNVIMITTQGNGLLLRVNVGSDQIGVSADCRLPPVGQMMPSLMIECQLSCCHVLPSRSIWTLMHNKYWWLHCCTWNNVLLPRRLHWHGMTAVPSCCSLVTRS